MIIKDEAYLSVYKKFLLHDDTWMADARDLPDDAWLELAELIHITTKEERGDRKKEEMKLMVSLMHDLC